MSKVSLWRTAMVAVIASVVVATTALAQMPTSPWKKGAPFPEADEELYGVPTNGKLYVFGGWDGGKARGVAYEYDPATDKWTKKTSMPRPAHHAALAAANGKIYVMGGFVPPKDTAIPVGGAWEPIDTAWEYDPAADSWKSLPPLPGKRGSAIAAEVGGKIYVIGGATTTEGSKDPFFTFFGPSRVLGTNEVYDPATNKWESRRPMSVPRNHAFGGVVNGKIYVIGGRTGHGFILSATNTDVVEEYNPVNDTWSVPKERMPTARSGGASGSDGRRIYVAGGEVTTKDLVGAFKSVEAYDPVTNSWLTLPSMPMPRHGIAGGVHRQSLSPGERDDAVGRGADVPRPDPLHAHGDARHSGAAVRCAAANRGGQERRAGAEVRVRRERRGIQLRLVERIRKWNSALLLSSSRSSRLFLEDGIPTRFDRLLQSQRALRDQPARGRWHRGHARAGIGVVRQRRDWRRGQRAHAVVARAVGARRDARSGRIRVPALPHWRQLVARGRRSSLHAEPDGVGGMARCHGLRPAERDGPLGSGAARQGPGVVS